MSYIPAVNPSMFGQLKGKPSGAVFTSTALAAIVGCLAMAFGEGNFRSDSLREWVSMLSLSILCIILTLTNVRKAIGCCFTVALPFSPLFLSIPAAATAPALVLVGLLMLEPIRNIPFEDFTESIPVFVCVIMMPLTYSISNGILL